MMYTQHEIELMREAVEGIYKCCDDCYRIYYCKKHKVFSFREQEQLAGICKVCTDYCEEDK